MPSEHFDLLIVGAGLSGIGAGFHLQQKCPGKSCVILEGRDCIGGTWDLFRYPGVRSDSDMYTLGYDFKPWTDPKAIADGPAILRYIRETAQEGGITQHIRFGLTVRSAEWSSPDACWTVTAESAAETTESAAETTESAAETTESAAETTESAAETTESAAETTESAADGRSVVLRARFLYMCSGY